MCNNRECEDILKLKCVQQVPVTLFNDAIHCINDTLKNQNFLSITFKIIGI